MPENLHATCLCYDHLAGQLGIEASEKLLSRDWLTQLDETHGAYDVTPEDEQTLAAIGVNVNALRNGRRRFAYGCMDRSERRPHLAGVLGVAVAERCITLGWLARRKHSRALNMTEVGRRELHAWLRTAQGPTAARQLVPRIDLTQSRWNTHMRSAL